MKPASLLCFALLAGCGKQAPAAWNKTEVMIPMRDGVRLHTLVYAPKNAGGKLPFLMERSPYGFTEGRPDRALETRYKQLGDEGFIFVFQDIRGRYQSEGQFVMQRPVHDRSISNSIDEGTDTYDTIEWLLKTVPNHNGRVGILGISYGGWLTARALIEPHPALKAASEQASPADMFLGDDFHHNGAFRLSYGFEYVSRMETGKVQYRFEFYKHDTFEWYLALGPLSEIDKRYFHGEKPTWNNFVNHPNYDSFWQQQAVNLILTKTTVPNLNVAGWWDQEDYYGPLRIYETLEKNDAADHKNHLVIGPWRPETSTGSVSMTVRPSIVVRGPLICTVAGSTTTGPRTWSAAGRPWTWGTTWTVRVAARAVLTVAQAGVRRVTWTPGGACTVSGMRWTRLSPSRSPLTSTRIRTVAGLTCAAAQRVARRWTSTISRRGGAGEP